MVDRLPETRVPIVCLDRDAEQIAKFSGDPCGHAARPDDLGYIIYTSGSTGNPKGVTCRHACLYNLICWQREILGDGLRTVQYASAGFDVSVQEILYSLSSGGELHMIDNMLHYDMRALRRFIRDRQLELLTMPFTPLNAFFTGMSDFSDLAGIKHLITSGEQFHISPEIRAFMTARPDVLVHNQYGPSETHVVTAYIMSGPGAPEPPPIGRPIANTQLYILDENMLPMPEGVQGELYLGGVNLARGYLNRPELTAEKFVTNPFSSEPGARLYRTGDVARWLPDGNVEFLGRNDDQIKIRGFRVQLDEIEHHLLNCPGVAEATIVVVDSAYGSKELAAYFVADDAHKHAIGCARPAYKAERIAAELHGSRLLCRIGASAGDGQRQGGQAGVAAAGFLAVQRSERVRSTANGRGNDPLRDLGKRAAAGKDRHHGRFLRPRRTQPEGNADGGFDRGSPGNRIAAARDLPASRAERHRRHDRRGPRHGQFVRGRRSHPVQRRQAAPCFRFSAGVRPRTGVPPVVADRGLCRRRDRCVQFHRT